MKQRTGVAWFGVTVLTLVIVGMAVGHPPATRLVAQEGAKVQAPRFEVDPFWPKPLPRNAIMGWVLGVAPDAQNNVWILQRPDNVERGVTMNNGRDKESPPNETAN